MTRITFTDDFDYKPVLRITIAYSKGQTYTVKQDCANQAIAAGKAVPVEQPQAETTGKTRGKTVDKATEETRDSDA